MTYPKAVDDQARVAFLHQLSVLDTSEDGNFDRITELCRDVFRVEISTVSLIDEHRQWFKSHVGLDACETDRELAFCNHTILRDEIFEVCDAALDPVFATNALVVGHPYIRYYAGAPLVYEGVRLGALCLIHSEPRPPLDDVQRRTLVRLADLVVREFEVQRLLRESLSLLVDI
jgi:GAF domain-containing protein